MLKWKKDAGANHKNLNPEWLELKHCIDILKMGTIPIVLLFGMFIFTLVIGMVKK